MASDKRVVGFVSMWPREICDVTIPERKGRLFIGEFEDLEKPGVYVLYRNDQPYYIGKAESLLAGFTTTLTRLQIHTSISGTSFRLLSSLTKGTLEKLRRY